MQQYSQENIMFYDVRGDLWLIALYKWPKIVLSTY